MESPSKNNKAQIAANRKRGRVRFRVEAEESDDLKTIQYVTRYDAKTGSYYELVLKEDKYHKQYIFRREIVEYEPSAYRLPGPARFAPSCTALGLTGTPVPLSGSDPDTDIDTDTDTDTDTASDSAPQPEPSARSKTQLRRSETTIYSRRPESDTSTTTTLRNRKVARTVRREPAVNQPAQQTTEDDYDNEIVLGTYILR